MAPRFGDATGDAANSEGRGQNSPWTSSFTGTSSEGSTRGTRGTISRVIAMLVPFIGVAVFAIIAMRAMGYNISMLWVVVLFGLPVIRRAIHLLKKNLGG